MKNQKKKKKKKDIKIFGTNNVSLSIIFTINVHFFFINNVIRVVLFEYRDLDTLIDIYYIKISVNFSYTSIKSIYYFQ